MRNISYVSLDAPHTIIDNSTGRKDGKAADRYSRKISAGSTELSNRPLSRRGVVQVDGIGGLVCGAHETSDGRLAVMHRKLQSACI